MLNLSKNKFFTGKKSGLFSVGHAKHVRAFHSSIEGYKPTPLVSLPALANYFGIRALLVKDESKRFELNAFKVLGGSYALGRQLAKYLNIDIADINLKTVSSKLEKTLTFATATAGNHGSGIAWAAREMEQKAVVYMPKGSPKASADRIRSLGAECIVTELNYDDTVRLANETARSSGLILVQDTAWDGYEEIPTWISQGYMTMADEAVEQVRQIGFNGPSHVILQAGVGTLAGGILGYLADKFDLNKLQTIIAEPKNADCIYRSGTSEAGTIVNVASNLNSIMAGLACGKPNPITWPTIKDCSHYFVAVEDAIATMGMHMYRNPLSGDDAITSGESGAITLGVLNELVRQNTNVGLNEEAIVLLFSTEGDTNPDRYCRIV